MKCAKRLSLAILFATLTAIGCSQSSPPSPSPKPAGTSSETGKEEPHVHGPGPNGGVVFDLGQYHGELTVDHDKQECTVLVLGEDEKTPTAVAATELTLTTKEAKTKDGTAVPAMTITLTAQDSADGKASKFVGTDPGLSNIADFEGAVIGEIDGKPAQGSFKE